MGEGAENQEAELERLQAELTQLHETLARFATENSSLRRLSKTHYEARRRLESKIRKVIVVGEHTSTDDLFDLRKMVPTKARPPWKDRIVVGRKGRK